MTTENEQAARDRGCVRRVRKLTGATLVQTLVFGYLGDPRASLVALTDLGADLSPQALDQRFTPAATRCLADVLTAALQRVLATTQVAIPLRRRFQGVYVFDTTTVSLPASLAALFPGCGGRAAGPMSAAPWRGGPLPAGALRLADRGFFALGVLQDYTDQGAFWIPRVPARLVVQPEQGAAGPLAEFLSRQEGDALDAAVRVGGAGPLACRLLARRAPAAVVAKRRSRLVKQAKKKGRPVSAAQGTLCAWTVYRTNLRADLLRWQDVWVLARARWQIELLFKLGKSHGGLEALRGGARSGRCARCTRS